jgi:DNA-binding transcriptional ArsR family regulator
MFGMLSATVRLNILWLLSSEDLDVSTLATMIGETPATTSHHLGKLKLAGLVNVRRQGKHRVYRRNRVDSEGYRAAGTAATARATVTRASAAFLSR